MNNSPLHLALGAALVGILGACASSASSGSTAARSGVDDLVWSGSLQPTQERTGAAVPTKQTNAYGRVRLSPAAQNLNRTAVEIVVSTPLQDPTELRWALLPGRCGTGSLPLLGYEQFPILEVGSNGRGQLTTEIPLTLPLEGTFHVNVYWRGTQLENVLTCANLRRA